MFNLSNKTDQTSCICRLPRIKRETQLLNAQLTSTFDNFSNQLYFISPSCKSPNQNMGYGQNSFSILACLQYKGGGILVTKNNLGDWRSPYSQSVLSRKESNRKVNDEWVQNFPYVLYHIIIKFGYNARCHWLKERAL